MDGTPDVNDCQRGLRVWARARSRAPVRRPCACAPGAGGDDPGMQAGVYLAVLAYPLRDERERRSALERGMAFAACLGLPLVPSPLIDELRPAGAWLSAERRREDLERALDHRVLLAARGGYGCIDLVETLQRCERRVGPLLVGYSDL